MNFPPQAQSSIPPLTLPVKNTATINTSKTHIFGSVKHVDTDQPLSNSTVVLPQSQRNMRQTDVALPLPRDSNTQREISHASHERLIIDLYTLIRRHLRKSKRAPSHTLSQPSLNARRTYEIDSTPRRITKKRSRMHTVHPMPPQSQSLPSLKQLLEQEALQDLQYEQSRNRSHTQSYNKYERKYKHQEYDDTDEDYDTNESVDSDFDY